MSVPEQIPYVGYVANGQTTEFPITFDLHDPEYLIVTVNKEIPAVGTYTVDMNALKVVFATAPTDGTQVELYRETELNRDTNYQKYDNSFRPEAVNYDFDKIWHVLQEQDMIDAELLARLKAEIEWRRTHDANFDELAKMRDAQIFSGLKGYVDTLYSASNPNIFEGVTAGIVFALDKKSVQTHLEIIYEQLKNNHSELDERLTEEVERATVAEQELGQSITNTQIDLNNKVNEERNRAIGIEQSLQLQITTGNAGIKYFSTEAEVLAFTPSAQDPKQAYAFDTKKNYLWNGSTWKDEGISPSDIVKEDLLEILAISDFKTKNALSEIQVSYSEDYPIVADSENKALVFFNKDADEIQGVGIVSDSKASKKGLEVYTGVDGVYPIITDEDYGVLMGYDPEYDKFTGNFNTQTSLTQKTISFPYDLPKKSLNQVLAYGQSLSTGTKGQPVLSTTQNFSNKTFLGGVLYWGSDESMYASAKPLIEEISSDQGETICSGLANYASLLAYKENQINPADHVIFASSAGVQGAPIDNLMRGQVAYSVRFIKHATAVRTINADTVTNFIVWMQGESDSGGLSTQPILTKDEYKSKFLTLVSNMNDDIRGYTGQQTPLIFLTYQHSSLALKNAGATQLAMLESMKENDKVYCIVPTYPFPHADGLHLTAVGYKWIGAYFGRAYKQIIHDRIKPLMIKPLNATYSKNKVTVNFDVPYKPLVLDVQNLKKTTNFGFAVKVGSSYIEVTAVKIGANGSSVELTLSSNIASGSTVEVRYALDYSGITADFSASGNLRDSCEESITINNDLKPLFYICPHFKLTAINGEI